MLEPVRARALEQVRALVQARVALERVLVPVRARALELVRVLELELELELVRAPVYVQEWASA